MIPAFQQTPFFIPFNLIDTPIRQIVKQLLKLLLSSIIYQFLLEYLPQLLLIGIFNKFKQLLLVHIEYNLSKILLFQPILKGQYKVNGLIEIPLEYNLLKKFYFLTIRYVSNLLVFKNTPVSR